MTEISCLIVLDSGNPAETWWHLMNRCDFWVKNSLQIQMILPPRPGVPAFFFKKIMALLEEIHITPVATDHGGFWIAYAGHGHMVEGHTGWG